MEEILNIILLVVQSIGLGAMVVLLIWSVSQYKEIETGTKKQEAEERKKQEEKIKKHYEEIMKGNDEWWRHL